MLLKEDSKTQLRSETPLTQGSGKGKSDQRESKEEERKDLEQSKEQAFSYEEIPP